MQCSNSKLFSFITVITHPSKVLHFSTEAGELHGACLFANLWHLNVSFVIPLCFVSFVYCINIISLLDMLIFLTHLFSCALVISDWKMLSFLQRYVNFSQRCLSHGVGINPTHYSVSDWGRLQSTKIKRLCLCSEFSCIRTDRLQSQSPCTDMKNMYHSFDKFSFRLSYVSNFCIMAAKCCCSSSFAKENVQKFQCFFTGHMQAQWWLYLSIFFSVAQSFQVQRKPLWELSSVFRNAIQLKSSPEGMCKLGITSYHCIRLTSDFVFLCSSQDTWVPQRHFNQTLLRMLQEPITVFLVHCEPSALCTLRSIALPLQL